MSTTHLRHTSFTPPNHHPKAFILNLKVSRPRHDGLGDERAVGDTRTAHSMAYEHSHPHAHVQHDQHHHGSGAGESEDGHRYDGVKHEDGHGDSRDGDDQLAAQRALEKEHERTRARAAKARIFEAQVQARARGLEKQTTENDSLRPKISPTWIHSMAYMELSSVLCVASSDHSLVFYDLASPNLDVHSRLLGIVPLTAKVPGVRPIGESEKLRHLETSPMALACRKLNLEKDHQVSEHNFMCKSTIRCH